MKLMLSVIWQSLVLYLAALVGFALGISVPALRVSRELSRTATNIRTYDFDWLLAVLLVYALLLLSGAARKRLRSSVVSATIALLLVVAAVALFTHLGIKNTAV